MPKIDINLNKQPSQEKKEPARRPIGRGLAEILNAEQKAAEKKNKQPRKRI